jgi:hypothetical protein
VQALKLCVENTRALERLLDKIDFPSLEKAQEEGDAARTHEIVRQVFFG